ncbi:DNRLRE domain-containing protein [Streptomyces sp. NPDC060223]|uniref:DNRLRE domain-containing protein n=1 Tax=unclassified Streptomyces TaxID=2593676 RepID=UPI00363EAFFF
MRRIALGLVTTLAAQSALVSIGSGAAFALPTSAASSGVAAASSDSKEAASTADSVTAALLMARLQDRKIEVTSERTTTSTTWALPSGELQTATYAGPVRQKLDGKWRDIDTALSDTGSSLEPKVAAADIKVSDGGDKSLASVAKGEKSFEMGWSDTLPKPEVKDDTASYDLGDGQTLTVTALSQGFSQNVVLDKAPDGELSYRIPVKLDGLKISEADSGHLLLKDAGGKLVAEAPAPMMWDSSKDAKSGESRHQAKVATKVETSDDGSQTLVLTPDADYFKQDPTYPVTVDPTSTLAVTTDTWVATNYTDSQVSSTELKSGTYDAGTTKARSYLKFDVSPFKGKHITDTNLALYSYYSSTCATSGAGTQVRRITSSWSSSDITWADQPTSTTTGAVTSTAAKGYSDDCPAGTVNFDIDAIVQAWADGSVNYGLRLASPDETDSQTWRRFRSANYVSGDGSQEPHLTVTYNSYTTTSALAISPSSVNAYNGKRYITTYTPTLSVKATDADGSSVKAQFEVTNDPAYTSEAAYSKTVTSASVASGGTATYAVPSTGALPAQHMRMRVRGYDGTDYGPWSSYIYFVPNVAKPSAPTVSCAAYPAGAWSAKAADGVPCTLGTSSTDGAGYQWSLDSTVLGQRALDTTNGTGGDTQTITIAPGNGPHVLRARTIDSGGNLSTATTAYSFGVGSGSLGVTAPRDGAWTTSDVDLTATGDSAFTGATWEYRRGTGDSWHTVPVGDVSKGSASVSAWPVAVTGGTATPLVWHMDDTLDDDGTVQLRATFTDGASSASSIPVSVTLDRAAGSAPQQNIGPGSVNLLTGDFSMTADDASVFDASVSRTFSSRAVDAESAGQAPVFGPGWVSSVTATTGVGYTSLRKTSATSVSLMNADGSSVAFTRSGTSTSWTPEPGAGQLTLTGALDQDTFTLQDSVTGVVSTFGRITGATTWTLRTSQQVTEDSTTSVVVEPVPVGSRTLSRPKYLISPNKAIDKDNTVCAGKPSTAGCRVLEFVYAGSTTAASGGFGDVKDQVKQVKVWATDPGAGAATATVVAQYAYDTDGLLREAWDPRVPTAQKETYSYDAAKRVVTYTPAGQLPWTLTYSTGTDASGPAGRLLKASRPTLAPGTSGTTNGTATTSVVYEVPVSGSTAPYPMDASSVAAWGQTDLPTRATAVFPADQVPAANTGAGLKAGDYRRATITYLDDDMNTVNVAEPGGHISTSEYDTEGNLVRDLTSANRELALGKSASSDALLEAELDKARADAATPAQGTAEAALMLSSTSVFTAGTAGTSLEREISGPLHTVTLRTKATAPAGGTDLLAGTPVLAREHTVRTYDENRPAGAAVADQVTTETTGALIDGYPADADAETVRTVYDWTTGLAVKEIHDPQGKAITTTAAYDAAGRQVSTTLPGATATGADTTTAAYWATSGDCAGHPEWAGLVCTITPGGAVTGGGDNPAQLVTKSFTYGRWGQADTVKETASGVTRTTTSSYDEAGRPLGTNVTGSTGTDMPATTITYGTSGLETKVTAGGRTITSTIDRLGREISYDDGTGNTTRTTYDALNRALTITDSVPSSTTYAYDTAADPRGLPTSVTDSVAGTFTGTYDGDGQLVKETLPGGNILTVDYDASGRETGREYADANGTTILADHGDYTIAGQLASHAQTDGGTIVSGYDYDSAGHLTSAQDDTGSTCTTRAYAFGDDRSNRTGLTTSTLAEACGSTTAPLTDSTSYAYDSADRLVSATRGTTTTKAVYDAFGRRTTGVDGTTVAYYTGDTVRQVTKDSARTTWGLDVAGRQASVTAETKAADGTWSTTSTTTQHYRSGADTPAWSSTVAGTATTVGRNVGDLTGGLSVVTSASGDTVLQLSNLHGDISVRLPLASGAQPQVQRYDEYGAPDATTATGRYGWLGTAARAADAPGGLLMMGARGYDPATGTFLQTDPVAGGGDNAYGYCSGDPVNCTDTSGTFDYWLKYNVGNPHMSAHRYFQKFRDNFNWVFPIGGHAKKLSHVGQKMDLWVKIAGVKIAFPVKVKSITSNGWKFDTRWGHPDYPGFISFYFTHLKSGQMRITIHGNVPPGADAWFIGKSNYVKKAKSTWAKLVSNLKDLTHYINTMGA